MNDAIGNEDVRVRRAGDGDAAALRQLAQLDGARPLSGDVLVAEVDGQLWVAYSLSERRAIGDPFRPTAALRALLELRARQLAEAGARSQRRARSAWRLSGPRRV
jgi:hypothetical protein